MLPSKPITTKICHSCLGDPQPLSNFTTDMRLKDCKVNVCNACNMIKVREKKARNDEKKKYQLF